MFTNNVNYIHNGKSLNNLIDSLALIENKVILKEDLLTHVENMHLSDDFYSDVIKNYKSNKAKKINLNELLTDIENSIIYSYEFQKIKCRGFSYKVHTDIELIGDELLPDINFRIALMPNENLFYPQRVRRYLRRILINHYKYDRYPSICFSIGKKTSEECFIFILQSDIIFRTPAFIREHFRGWRKVLMNTIIDSLKTECKNIYLPFSRDVLMCSHPFKMPSRVPKIWESIYDQTAKDFGFSFVKVMSPVNIQIYKNLQSVEVSRMYKLKIN